MPKKQNTRRKDGLISVQVYIGRDENKKRKYKTVYGASQKEADAKAADIRTAMRKGLDVTAGNDTFAEWADRWIRIKKTEVCDTHYRSYKSNCAYLKESFGWKQINKVIAADIQDVILNLADENPKTKKPSSQKTLANIRSTARQIMQLAVENRVIDYNPAMAVKVPKGSGRRQRRALTADEMQWIEDTFHRAQLPAMIMMYAGLRRGELIPLTWNDIDIKNRMIHIGKSVERIDGKLQLKNYTKTEAGIRTVDIPQKLADYLSTIPRQSIYVCVSASGKMHTESSWDRMWESYLADLNIKYGDFSPFEKRPKGKFDPGGVPFVIPRITAHWLRHTFATLLYLAGYDIKAAMSQMGHADMKTLLQIYTHLDQVHKRKSMNKLDEYLSGKNNNASIMQVESI